MLVLGVLACSTPRQIQEPGTAAIPSVIRVDHIKGTYPEIVSVKLQILDGPIEAPMKPVGEGVWEADLSPEQIQRLPRKVGRLDEHPAEVVIQSQNSYGQKNLEVRSLKVIVTQPGIQSS